MVSAWSIWRAPYIPCTGRCVPDSRDKIDFIRHLCHNNRQNSPLVFTFNIPSNCYHKFTIQASYLIFLVHVFHFHHSILTVPLATILSPASFFYPGHPARFSSVEWIPVKVFRKLPLSRRYRLFAVSGSCMSGSLAYVRLRPSTVRTFFTNGGMEKWRNGEEWCPKLIPFRGSTANLPFLHFHRSVLSVRSLSFFRNRNYFERPFK